MDLALHLAQRVSVAASKTCKVLSVNNINLLFLMGIDFPSLLIALVILGALGFGIFILIRLIFRKSSRQVSRIQIFLLSLSFAIVLTPIAFGLLIWALMVLLDSLK